MVGFVGGFCGKLLGSACLRLNIDSLGPLEEGSLGAWWLGWPLIAVVHTCLAVGFLFLPHHLPTTREEEPSVQEPMATDATTSKFQLKSILDDLKRLVKNRVLMCDSLAMAFFLLSTANRAYIAKFVEVQFNTSPSAASLFSGSSTMLGAISALAISIVVISWFKPSARALAAFNVFADICSVVIGKLLSSKFSNFQANVCF